MPGEDAVVMPGEDARPGPGDTAPAALPGGTARTRSGGWSPRS